MADNIFAARGFTFDDEDVCREKAQLVQDLSNSGIFEIADGPRKDADEILEIADELNDIAYIPELD